MNWPAALRFLSFTVRPYVVLPFIHPSHFLLTSSLLCQLTLSFYGSFSLLPCPTRVPVCLLLSRLLDLLKCLRLLVFNVLARVAHGEMFVRANLHFYGGTCGSCSWSYIDLDTPAKSVWPAIESTSWTPPINVIGRSSLVHDNSDGHIGAVMV